MSTPPCSIRTALNAGVILMALMTLVGCAATTDRGLSPRRVDVSDFSDPAQRPIDRVPATDTESAQRPSPGLAATSEEEVAARDVAAPSSAPAPAAPARRVSGERLTQPGDVVVIDSLIGQVSGRPIFADALLQPIAERLRAEIEGLDARESQIRMQQIIMDRLREVVLTELFIAEAEAALTPEQQQGLFAFLRHLQERTIATGRGSRTVTEQRLLEEQGMTLEQYTERERQMVLVQMLINQKVRQRVIVSWRDVQREYDRNVDRFNPPASVTLRILRINKRGEDERIEQVKTRLANGEPFDDVVAAIAPNDVSTLDPFAMGPGGITDIEISETFKPYLEGLDVGETTQAIETDTRVTWLHVAAIDQPPALSLYDVQRQLKDALENRREAEERDRYIGSLFAKGMHDELDAMLSRAMTVALLRYGQ